MDCISSVPGILPRTSPSFDKSVVRLSSSAWCCAYCIICLPCKWYILRIFLIRFFPHLEMLSGYYFGPLCVEVLLQSKLRQFRSIVIDLRAKWISTLNIISIYKILMLKVEVCDLRICILLVVNILAVLIFLIGFPLKK